jgi:hypothetical protein
MEVERIRIHIMLTKENHEWLSSFKVISRKINEIVSVAKALDLTKRERERLERIKLKREAEARKNGTLKDETYFKEILEGRLKYL